jgi:hypothetical protein
MSSLAVQRTGCKPHQAQCGERGNIAKEGVCAGKKILRRCHSNDSRGEGAENGG